VDKGASQTAADPPLGVPAPIADPLAVARGQADHKVALALLMQRHGTEIYRFCVSTLSDRDLADDVHQSVFLVAFERLASLEHVDKARPWLFAIARHRCLDALRAQRRRKWRFVLFADPDEGHATPAEDRSEPDEAASEPRIKALLACLQRLAPHVRVAVLLRYQDDLPYPEIARMSREKASALQMRVSRGIESLRRCMKRPWEAAA
jgi:RNA polymerase sigma factor (sigma-70 family)